MGDWLWILILVFILFRFLARAGKQMGKAPPTSPSFPGKEPEPEKEELGDLQELLEKLSGRPSPRPVIPPPPPLRHRSKVAPGPIRKEKPPKPPPRIIPEPPLLEPVRSLPPAEKTETLARQLRFSSEPLIQGIIFAEIIGPPKSERPGAGLPGD